MHNGRYGLYVEWGSTKKSIRINKKKEHIQLADVIPMLSSSSSSSSSIIRHITDSISIRSGKYGDYIFYKKPTCKKPTFIKLTEFIKKHGVNSYKTCDQQLILEWMSENYTI